MKTGIIAIGSSLHDDAKVEAIRRDFLRIAQNRIECSYIDDQEIATTDFLVFFIMTGGSETRFREIVNNAGGLNKPFVIAATCSDNSLPASLEILAWLRGNGNPAGRIIHGSCEEIVAGIEEELLVLNVMSKLRQQVIGVIGDPSDWLIASSPSLDELTRNLGIICQKIPMSEFRQAYEKPDSAAMTDFARTCLGYGLKNSSAEMVKAAKIYAGLVRIARKYGLTGLTLRCFDIFASDQTTGCLGIAKLNDDGIPASCEGDVPALISMLLLFIVTARPVFMANPSRIKGDHVTFAHCTCPISILEKPVLMTHFESGAGLAVGGTLAQKEFTLLKLDLEHGLYAMQTGEKVPHQMSGNLCRTQVCISLPGAEDYFFRRALGNHHVMVAGNHVRLLGNILARLNFRPVW
jgi:L-fucose isomerase-like protein